MQLHGDKDWPVASGEAGQLGKLCVRGPEGMQGYLNHPELTAQTLRDGRLHADDMARAYERGHLFIAHRKKVMICVSPKS